MTVPNSSHHPASSQAMPNDVSTAIAELNAPANGAVGTGFSILLADDDQFARTALGYILTHAGFAVDQVNNGMEALSQAKGKTYHCILLDVQMAGMDGLRVLANLRKEPQTKLTPVLMVSGVASTDNVKASAKFGATSFIVKQGMNPEQLVAKILKAASAYKTSLASSSSAVSASSTSQSPNVSPTSSVSNTANVSDGTTPLDTDQWKQKATTLGRSDREQTRILLAPLLPPVIVPAVLDDIRSASEKKLSHEQVVRLIEQDISLSLKILDTANKGTNAPTEQVRDIDSALKRIGSMGLQEILQQLTNTPPIAPAASDWVHRWWQHSLAVSAVAGELALAMDVSTGTARLAGLIHDLGRLLLLTSSLHEKTITCYDLARNMIFPTTMAEQFLFGLNHKQVGQEFVDRLSLPALVTTACTSHDHDDVLLARMGEPESTMATVINAADQIAKAAGYGSLPSDELLPLPAAVAAAATELQLQIDAALEQVKQTTLFRLGKQVPQPIHQSISLAGITVGFVSQAPGPWNPYQRTMTAAGVTVTAFADVKQLLDKPLMFDMLVIDLMPSTLATALPMLRRIHGASNLAACPKLLLARRSDEPELIVSQSGLKFDVYPSPIRAAAFLQAIQRLAGT